MARPRIYDRPMTDAERMRRYRARVKAKKANFIPGDEWGTPGEYIELARAVMGGIDLDPASNEHAQRTVQAGRFFTKDDDGLAQPWTGKVWLNPPYSRRLINRFVTKICAEYLAGNVTEAIVLTHSRTDTAWFRKLVNVSICYCNTNGRIRFETIDGVGNSPPTGSTFFYLGEHATRFYDVFQSVGKIASDKDIYLYEMAAR